MLTPDFVYVMGGEEGAMFETYKNLCCRAFLTLRRKADLIINLFSLVSTAEREPIFRVTLSLSPSLTHSLTLSLSLSLSLPPSPSLSHPLQMRSTGIPELTCVEDTDYIRNALVLDKTEQEAEQLFRKVIKKCLDLKWTVQMMWKIHLIRKKGTP